MQAIETGANPDDRSLAVVATVHVAATMFMVGLIWVVQVVHYPLFADVGAAAYPDYQEEHIERIGRLLVVPWGLEGLSVVALLLVARDRTTRAVAVAGAVLMGLILVVTAVWAAPAHGDLTEGFDPDVHRRLLDANLVRALLWTARGALAVALVWILLDRRSSNP